MAHYEVVITLASLLVGDLDKSFDLVSDSQDVTALIESYAIDQDEYPFRSFFVKIEDGDYSEVYGCLYKIPYDGDKLWSVETFYS